MKEFSIEKTHLAAAKQQRQVNYTIRALICARASVATVSHFTTWSKPEVYLYHTPYFHTETLAIILELFSILYCCYYSQNYSGIIISGLGVQDAHCLYIYTCAAQLSHVAHIHMVPWWCQYGSFWTQIWALVVWGGYMWTRKRKKRFRKITQPQST